MNSLIWNIPGFRKVVDWGTSQVFDIIESSELAQRVAELEDTYSTPTLIAWAIAATTLVYVWRILQNSVSERKFNRMDYSDMINISYTDIKNDGTIKIENELEWHLPTIFKNEPVVLKIIRTAAKDTDSSNITLRFRNDQQWWQVYERIRDHPQLLWGKINITQTHARRKAGEEMRDIEYVWILTEWPQYTVDEQKNLREVEWNEIPHTKAEIRFLPFILPNIITAITWFEDKKREDESIDDVMDKVCTDKDSCCSLTDEFISYMLNGQQQDDLNFKYPTYRKRIVALAQAAREYYHKRPHLRYTVSV